MAIAAKQLKEKMDLQKILIIDWVRDLDFLVIVIRLEENYSKNVFFFSGKNRISFFFISCKILYTLDQPPISMSVHFDKFLYLVTKMGLNLVHEF